MAVSRRQYLVRKALFLTVLFLLMVLALPACVSVQKTGEGTASEAPVTAKVSFHSNPVNGEVYVDGEFRGTATVVLLLSTGNHAIEVKLEGYQTWSRELTVVAGNDTRVSATLQPE